MDTSIEYIEMCEKALDEIQRVWTPANGDCFAICINSEWRSGIVADCGEAGQKHYRSYSDDPDNEGGYLYTWLPRQDQLQEIIMKDGSIKTTIGRMTFEVAFGLSVVFTERVGRYTKYNWSMEQLWLAFVMKEKYGKIWDGTKYKEVRTDGE